MNETWYFKTLYQNLKATKNSESAKLLLSTSKNLIKAHIPRAFQHIFICKILSFVDKAMKKKCVYSPRVSRLGVFFFFFSGRKNDPKTQKFQQQKKKTNPDIFFFWKILWLIFKNLQLKLFDFDQKMADFTRFWKNLKRGERKICQNGKFGLVAPIKQVLFCFCFCFFFSGLSLEFDILSLIKIWNYMKV